MIPIAALLERFRLAINPQNEIAVPLPVPMCPDCRHSMVLRRSVYGPFWGCSRYTAGCRGTRKL